MTQMTEAQRRRLMSDSGITRQVMRRDWDLADQERRARHLAELYRERSVLFDNEHDRNRLLMLAELADDCARLAAEGQANGLQITPKPFVWTF